MTIVPLWKDVKNHNFKKGKAKDFLKSSNRLQTSEEEFCVDQILCLLDYLSNEKKGTMTNI